MRRQGRSGESDPLVVEGDEAAVGDGDTVGVAREIAQDFLRPPKRTLGVDHPLAVAQRRQIGCEGARIRE